MKPNKMKASLFLLLLCLPVISICQETASGQYDLVIKNAEVLDGTGAGKYFANILIDGDSIVEIQRDTTRISSVVEVIDAKGFTVTPGFIDTHAHGDPLETPQFENFLAMGVTTISLGQDGFSPEEEDLENWFNQVETEGTGVNILTFAGHNTLRTLSGINYNSNPTGEKLDAQQRLLKEALKAGAFGLSTGLEYSPGDFAEQKELLGLAKVVGEEDGIIMSHMRNEDDPDVEASIKELLEQGNYCPVHISHIKVVYGKGEERAREILNLLERAREKGVKVTADIYPYTASHTGIAILFPEWAKKPNDYEEVKKSRRGELENFLREKVAQRNGPGATLIGSGPYKGKTLEELEKDLEKPFEKILIEDIGPYGAGAAHFVMDEELQDTFLLDEYINVCSDGSPGMHHPRGYGSFSRIIEKYVIKEEMLPLEKAVFKMTGLPADVLKINDRGRIKVGNKADILIFKPEEVKEKATYEDPKQLSEGMTYVIVNGKIVLEMGEFKEERAGKILRKK